MHPNEHQQRVERRLAAIFAADVAGYSRLMSEDEAGTLRALAAAREVMDRLIAEHGGRIANTAGDSVLAEFPSAVDAVQCAVAVQEKLADFNSDVAEDRRLQFRIGVHLGDVAVRGGDLLGDGVNVAARVEGLAEPGGVCLSEAVHAFVRKALPLTYTDLGEQAVKNIDEPVRGYAVRPSIPPVPSRSMPKLLPLPEKPSIAVLPFTNMSGDPEQEYFADGMVEEIITTLSRIRWLFVIARNSSFTYKGRAVDVKQVGRELGVRYVLEGSVRKAGSRVRIAGQLIEASSGAHLWADRFDGSLENIFELQDQVATSVAGVIEPTLQAAEMRRSAERPTSDPTAYDLYLRAVSCPLDKEGIVPALDLVTRAIKRDSRFGPALSLAARFHMAFHVNGWDDDPEAHRREGIDLGRRALDVASDDPFVLANSANVLAYFGEDIAAAMNLIDMALTLNPSFAQGWMFGGWLRLWAAQPDTAISCFETALRLSPRAGRTHAFLGIGVGHFFARRLEEAKVMLLQSLQERANWAPTYRFLAACYAHMGRLEEAQEIIRRLRAITPLVIPDARHWRDSQQREFYLKGLRLATGEAT